MNDKELQAAYGELLRARHPERKACPAPEQIRALVERAGSEANRLSTLDHVMSCAACRAEFDLIQAVAAGRVASVRRYATPLAAAAVVALLFSGTMLFIAVRARAGDDKTLRGGQSPMELVSPRGDAGNRPVNFVWRSIGEPALYTLEVFTPAGDVFFTTELGDTAVTLPEDGSLVAGQTYHWWVSARTPDGRESRTPPASFKP